MGYILKTFDGKYWNKRHGSSALGWVDDLQDATVYQKYPTIVLNNRREKCYIVKVTIVENEIHNKTLAELIGLRNEFWRKNLS